MTPRKYVYLKNVVNILNRSGCRGNLNEQQEKLIREIERAILEYEMKNPFHVKSLELPPK